MKTYRAALAVLLSGISFCMNAAEHDTLEKMFPSISIFRKGALEIKNDKANTKSVRYTGPHPLFFTVSVLNPVHGEIADGVSSPELKQAFTQAVETEKRHRKDLAVKKTETLTLSCLAGRELTGLFAFLTCQENGREHHICLFLAPYRGNLLKIELAPEIPLQAAPQEKLFRLFLEQAKSNFYHGEKTKVSQRTKDVIARAVKALEENPLGTGSMAAQAVRKFTDDSRDVFVMVRESDFPWLPKTVNGTPKEKKYLNLLLASFMGGNIRAQLERDVCQDMREAGLVSMKKTYAKLKAADRTFQMHELEQSEGK